MAKVSTLSKYIYQRNCIVPADKTQIVSDIHNNVLLNDNQDDRIGANGDNDQENDNV